MATLYKELILEARPEDVWDAVRDVGALHTRLVPGFVVDTKLEGDEARIVTFANGMVVREPLISIDDGRRRLAWAAEGASTTHYNAALEVSESGRGTCVTWTTDLLPCAMADAISSMQDAALKAMKLALDGGR